MYRSINNFEEKTFRYFGMQIDYRDIYTFADRWLFSTNTNI